MNQKVFIIIIFFTIPQVMAAESIFLKNGQIIEGTLQKEKNEKIEIKLFNGSLKTYKSSEVIRINYNEDYKTRVFIYFEDFTYIEAHLVGEDQENYVCRPNLNLKDEVFIKKSLVKLMTKEKLSEIRKGLNLTIGSGSFFSVSLFYQIDRLEILMGLGYFYIIEQSIKKHALPIKGQITYKLIDSETLAIYGFGNGSYILGLKDYQPQFGFGVGVGAILFKKYFLEGSYQSVFEKSGVVLGLGVKIYL